MDDRSTAEVISDQLRQVIELLQEIGGKLDALVSRARCGSARP